MLDYHLYDFNGLYDFNFRRGYSRFLDKIAEVKDDLSKKYKADVFEPEVKDSIVIAVGRGGEYIGFIVWRVLPDKMAFVGLAHVAENWRGRGIYKEMLKRVADLAHQRGATSISLAVAGANDLSIAVHDAIFGTPEIIIYTKPINH